MGRLPSIPESVRNKLKKKRTKYKRNYNTMVTKISSILSNESIDDTASRLEDVTETKSLFEAQELIIVQGSAKDFPQSAHEELDEKKAVSDCKIKEGPACIAVDDYEREMKRINEAIMQSQNKPAERSETIGRDGGRIELCDFIVEFPKDALHNETKITISVDNNPANYPSGRIPFTPILICKPPMKFNKPVKIIATCCCVAYEERGEEVEVWSKKKGYNDDKWFSAGKLMLKNCRELTFTVKHFCQYQISPVSNIPQVDQLGFNVVFGRRNPSLINSFFYADKKALFDINSTGLKQLTQCPISFKFRFNLEIKLDMKIHEPRNTEIIGNKNVTLTDMILLAGPKLVQFKVVPEFPLNHNRFRIDYTISGTNLNEQQIFNGDWTEVDQDKSQTSDVNIMHSRIGSISMS